MTFHDDLATVARQGIADIEQDESISDRSREIAVTALRELLAYVEQG